MSSSPARSDRRCGCVACCETEPAERNPAGNSTLTLHDDTHARVLARLKERLSAPEFPQLHALTTRAVDDPTIALLDVWASIADVLSFYSQQIANEGYLRTAIEQRSLTELAAMVGYRPRQGVAASSHVALVIEEFFPKGVVIPAGTRIQSVPVEAEEVPQTFETDDEITARPAWNAMVVRSDDDMPVISTNLNDAPVEALDVAGRVSLAVGSKILAKAIEVTEEASLPVRAVLGVSALSYDPGTDRTHIEVSRLELTTDTPRVTDDTTADPNSGGGSVAATSTPPILEQVIAEAQQAASVQPLMLSHTTSDPALSLGAELNQPLSYSILARDSALSAEVVPSAIRAYAELPRAAEIESASRSATRAPLFGHNAPPHRIGPPTSPTPSEPIILLAAADLVFVLNVDAGDDEMFNQTMIVLDRVYEGVDAGSEVLVEIQRDDVGVERAVHTVAAADVVAVDEWGMTGQATRLEFEENWAEGDDGDSPDVMNPPFLRRVSVYLDESDLALDRPLRTAPVRGGEIELDLLYDDFEPGRNIIVEGLRSGLGVRGAERALVQRVSAQTRSGQSSSTVLHLDQLLAYEFDPADTIVRGNVVPVSHGESRNEVIGDGDGARPLLELPLRHAPVTRRPSVAGSGSETTLEVAVNGLRWSEAPDLVRSGPADRHYVTRTIEGKPTVVFGDGVNGARTPTGQDNVVARYRNGIGQSGNLAPDQLAMVVDSHRGLEEVRSPLPATGGADPDGVDAIRERVPLSLLALDRLVSVSDYEAFARLYDGLGKAHASESGNGITLTVAPTQDGELAADSELLRGLRRSFTELGDPSISVSIVGFRRLLLVTSLGIEIAEDRYFDDVEPAVRAAYFEAFGFADAQLGEPVHPADIVRIVDAVDGVVASLVRGLGWIATSDTSSTIQFALDAVGSGHFVGVDDSALEGSSAGDAAALIYVPDDLQDALVVTQGLAVVPSGRALEKRVRQ